MNKNIILIGAIIGIGLFMLPSTLSMFAGQHSWYDPDSVPCEKCHFIEEQELAGGGPHATVAYTVWNTSNDVFYSEFWGDTEHCGDCHQSSTYGFENDTVHAAFAVQCEDCHDWVPGELTAPGAAHADFYTDLNVDSGPLEYANKACIGCHTHVGVNISWTRAAYVQYDVTTDGTGYVIDWNTTGGYGTNDTEFQSQPGYP